MQSKHFAASTVLGVLVIAMLAVGCTKDENPMSPQVTDFTGQWSGNLHHPGYDGGSLTMTPKENPDSIYRSYTMRLTKRLSNGRVQVSQFGGEVIGGHRTGNASMNFSFIVSGTSWDFVGADQRPSALTGPWQSRAP